MAQGCLIPGPQANCAFWVGLEGPAVLQEEFVACRIMIAGKENKAIYNLLPILVT